MKCIVELGRIERAPLLIGGAMKIHDYPADALCQWYYGRRDEWGDWSFEDDESMDYFEDVDGATALREIEVALRDGCEPIYAADGEVMGYVEKDGEHGNFFTNCDEYTYEEYYGEPYRA